MPSLKQEALDAISKLPDTATMDEIMYRLYVIDKIHAGLEDAKNGKIVSTTELEHEIQSW